MFFKKWGLLLVAAVLVLTGCANEAALVRDATVTSMEKPNYDFKSSIKLTGNFDELMDEAKGNKKDVEEGKAIIKAMKEGLTIEGSNLDLNTSKMVFILNDDRPLRDNHLWASDKKAALELLVDNNSFYVTTPADDKYLFFDPTSSMPEDEAITQEKLKNFQEKINKLTIDFAKKYVAKFGFELSQAKNHGSTTVQLPNGQSVKATHVSMTFDTKELITLGLFIAKDATTNAEVKSFAIDLLATINKFVDENSPEGKVKTEAEYKTEAKVVVEKTIEELKQELEMSEKMFTPDSLVEMAKKQGLEAFTLTLDYYIDENKMPVRASSNVSVTMNIPSEMKKPFTFGIESDTYAWNFGKATPFTLPAAEKVVSYDQIVKDKKAIENFNKDGFLHAVLKEINKKHVFIVLDLNDHTAHVDGDIIENVRPYQTKGTTMVPFRFIADQMGAKTEFNAKTKTAVFTKENTRIELTAGSKIAKVNGADKTLSTPVAIIKGTLYVPLRFISDELGAEVDWIDSEKQAIIEFDKYE